MASNDPYVSASDDETDDFTEDDFDSEDFDDHVMMPEDYPWDLGDDDEDSDDDEAWQEIASDEEDMLLADKQPEQRIRQMVAMFMELEAEALIDNTKVQGQLDGEDNVMSLEAHPSHPAAMTAALKPSENCIANEFQPCKYDNGSGYGKFRSALHHYQTCDSCCAGPVCDAQQDLVTVLQQNALGVLDVKNLQSGAAEAGPSSAGAEAEQGPAAVLSTSLPPDTFCAPFRRVSSVYSIQWDSSRTFLAAASGRSHLQFWVRRQDVTQMPEDAIVPARALLIPDAHKQPGAEPEAFLRSASIEDLFQGHSMHLRHNLMLNCVRFGQVCGQERAIVAGQNGIIYIFNLPDLQTVKAKHVPAAAFLCPSLRPGGSHRFGSCTSTIDDFLAGGVYNAPQSSQAAPAATAAPRRSSEHARPIDGESDAATAAAAESDDSDSEAEHVIAAELTRLQPVILEDGLGARLGCGNFFDSLSHAQLASPVPDEAVGYTVGIGSFRVPVNSVQPSPDGRWMCVLGDSMHAVLLPEALDYNPWTACALQWDARTEEHGRHSNCIGCQYSAWSPDSQYLAVTSDSHRALAVWAVDGSDAPPATPHNKLGSSLLTALRRTCSAHGPEHRQPSRRRQLRALGRAFWGQHKLRHICAVVGQQQACLAVTFVPALPSTVVWLEAHETVHIMDVTAPKRARHYVSLRAIPVLIALASGRIAVDPSEQFRARVAALHAVFERHAQGCAACDARYTQAAPIVVGPHGNRSIRLRRATSGSGADQAPGVKCILEEYEDQALLKALERLDQGLRSRRFQTSLLTRQMDWQTTGLALSSPSSVTVTTKAMTYNLALRPEWGWGERWPKAFRKAAATLLLIHAFGLEHAAGTATDTLSLWSLPMECLRIIVKKVAGEQSEWLAGPPRLEVMTRHGLPLSVALSPQVLDFWLSI